MDEKILNNTIICKWHNEEKTSQDYFRSNSVTSPKRNNYQYWAQHL